MIAWIKANRAALLECMNCEDGNAKAIYDAYALFHAYPELFLWVILVESRKDWEESCHVPA